MRDGVPGKRMVSAFGGRHRRVTRVRPGTLPGTLLADAAAGPSQISVLTWTRADVRYDQVPNVEAALLRAQEVRRVFSGVGEEMAGDFAKVSL